MILPERFRFSQGNLQDFVDCRRRFLLRHVLRQAWPAVESEPFIENEQFMQQGQQFHHLVHQFFIGIPPEKLTANIQDPELASWWNDFLAYTDQLTSSKKWEDLLVYPEITLTYPVEGYYIVAKFDLIVISPDGGAVIYDWKTSRMRPKQSWLHQRLQTRVYPYLLARSDIINKQGIRVNLEQIEMKYWFANFSDQMEVFKYNKARFQEDQEYLRNLISLIIRLDDDDFTLTADEMKCRYCVYRSLCDRGTAAGELGEQIQFTDSDEGIDFALDLDQVEGIKF